MAIVQPLDRWRVPKIDDVDDVRGALDELERVLEKQRFLLEQGDVFGAINIKEAGAKGDGVTDDTEVIQGTIDELPDSGGAVYFPFGEYCVSSTINIPGGGVSILGDGASYRGAVDPGGPYGSIIIACASMTEVINWTGENGTLDNMHIHANDLANTALDVTGEAMRILGCVFQSGLTETLRLGSFTGLCAESVADANFNGTPAHLTPSTGTDQIVTSCRFIKAADLERVLKVSSGTNRFVNCHFTSGAGADLAELVLVEVTGNGFLGCRFDSALGMVNLKIDANNTWVTGCQFKGNGGNNPAISVLAGGNHSTVVTGCLFQPKALAEWSVGIDCADSTAADRTVFAGNEVATASGLYSGIRPGVVRANVWHDTVGGGDFYDNNSGISTVADGDTITHNLERAPRSVQLTAATDASRFVAAHTVGATTFTVRLHDTVGAITTAEDVYWYAEI